MCMLKTIVKSDLGSTFGVDLNFFSGVGVNHVIVHCLFVGRGCRNITGTSPKFLNYYKMCCTRDRTKESNVKEVVFVFNG